jgi:quinol monooxygenase YgiN
MNTSRRELLVWMALAGVSLKTFGETEMSAEKKYGIIGKMIAIPGKRHELANILIEGVAGMPGCLSYVVANDLSDEDALWITEVWESQSKHNDSLKLESVRNAISKGRPLIAGFGERYETQPVGGEGI